jgi:hypothetical protein
MVERIKEEEYFGPPTAPFSVQPSNQNAGNVESQESRLTFGAKRLCESRAEEQKEKKLKFYEEPPSKQKGFMMNMLKMHEPSSNFSISRS